MTSSGSLVAMSPSRPMTASPARRSGRSVSQRSFPSLTSSAAASAAQPDLPEGHRLLWSQIHGLGTNAVIPGLESTTCDDVHSDTQEVLQILEQTDVIKEGRAWLEIHEQIYIAVWMSLASSD
jgi:hypothetical protein